jgi:hypothetical protein
MIAVVGLQVSGWLVPPLMAVALAAGTAAALPMGGLVDKLPAHHDDLG